MGKILVIDDDKLILEGVKTILDEEGYVVETISDWPGVFEPADECYQIYAQRW